MLRQKRRGLSSIFLFLILVVMTMFCTLAVDFGRIKLAEAQLQDVADSAARHGAAGLWKGVDEVKARVIAVGDESRIEGEKVVFNLATDLEFGKWDAEAKTFTVLTGSSQSNANAIRVTANRIASRGTGLKGTFISAFSNGSTSRKASAIAGFGSPVDVHIVQDVTTSFADEIEDAKKGDKELINAIHAHRPRTTQVGLSVFTGWGKTMVKLVPIQPNHGLLTSEVSKLAIAGTHGMPRPSGTDIAAGLEDAMKNFTDPDYVPSRGSKAVVLVSDGEPNADRDGSHPTLSDVQLYDLAKQRADELWAQKIHVYVVFFNRDNNQLAADRLKGLARGAGIFVQETDPKKLPAALKALASRMPVQIVK